MKVVCLFYYLIVQITIIHATNDYLGCFIDQIGHRDLSIFIGDDERLTPKQCILVCHEQNFPYAAIQYGNECRCGGHYGRYGQVSEDECDRLCSTSEKCGGDKRNSVYNVVNSLDEYHTASTCENKLVGYHGCFHSASLSIKMDAVNSIHECLQRCAIKYNYAGIMNGSSCYCGDDFNLPSSNSHLCNIRCHKNSNVMNIDCCGGVDVFSVYSIKNYQSPAMNDLFETIVRVKRADAVNDTTQISSQTTYASPTATTVIGTVMTSQQSSRSSSSLPISSSFYSDATSSPSTNSSQAALFTTSSTNNIFNSVYSSLMTAGVTSVTPVSSTNTVGALLTTAYVSTSSASTLAVSNTVATSTSSIGTSQSTTNLITATTILSGSSPMYSSIYTYSRENTATTVPVSSVTYTSPSSLHPDTLYQTSIGIASSPRVISSPTSSHMDASISNNPISSIPPSSSMISNTPTVTGTTIHTDTTQGTTLTRIVDSSPTGSRQYIGTSLTSTLISASVASQLLSTASTHLSETSTALMSSLSIPPSTITSTNPSSFSTIMTTEPQRISSIVSTYSSHLTPTVSEQSSSGQSTVITSLSSTNSLASSSTNVGTRTSITSSSPTGITNQTTAVTITSVSNSSVPTTISTTLSTLPTTTIVDLSYVITTVLIVPSNQSFNPNDNNTRESIRQRFVQIVTLGFRCLANSSSPNCTQHKQHKQRVIRQICPNAYDVNLVSNITEISNSTARRYQTKYTVLDLCNSNRMITPTQVKAAADTLSRAQVTSILAYDYDGDLIRSTTIVNPESPAVDRKLWLIGAVLGPVAFAILLIFICCYLHYKCRPRPANRALDKPLQNAPLSTRSTTNPTALTDVMSPKPSGGQTIHALTQNDPLVGAAPSSHRLTPTESDGSADHIRHHPISTEIPMDEIRRQNDVERWRNKLRLQEKFQQPSIGYQESSVPNTNRSSPYQYDNRVFDHDRSTLSASPANGIMSNRTPQLPEIQAGRTKLHRLLDEVLDKADSEETYNPDTDMERQKRHRQRRQLPSISDDPQILPLSNNAPSIPHTPVIAQVSERPDPSLVRLRYNPYEAGDRAHAISRLRPVELTPKYDTDDQQNNQYNARSNPPLFYDDSNIADRAATATDAYATPKRYAKTRLETDQEAMMRHNGGLIERREHKFNHDGVYVDAISKHRGQTRTAWAEPDIHNDEPRRSDYRDEYIMAKRSVLNTKNIISSIHDELQHIVLPKSEDYHA